jgi:hypothetical protein
MTTSKIIPLAGLSLAFYACGGFCILKTSTVVGWARRNYTQSKFAQAYPLSGMIMKPWYPAFIVAAGIFICLWSLMIDYLFLFRGFG